MCKCCRLAKCFRVGMKKELILTNNEKEQRRMLIEHNRQKRKLKDEKAKKLTIVGEKKHNFIDNLYYFHTNRFHRFLNVQHIYQMMMIKFF